MDEQMQEAVLAEPETAEATPAADSAATTQSSEDERLRRIVRETIAEALKARTEPAPTELDEERRRREALEQKLNELVEENRQARAKAEEAERHGAIRVELQRLGVAKVDLAFRAVRDEIHRSEDGRLTARTALGETSLGDYLKRFLEDNPELLPARISGGSGLSPTHRGFAPVQRIDLDKIRPGMSREELDQARQEIVRVANQTFRGF